MNRAEFVLSYHTSNIQFWQQIFAFIRDPKAIEFTNPPKELTSALSRKLRSIFHSGLIMLTFLTQEEFRLLNQSNDLLDAFQIIFKASVLDKESYEELAADKMLTQSLAHWNGKVSSVTCIKHFLF